MSIIATLYEFIGTYSSKLTLFRPHKKDVNFTQNIHLLSMQNKGVYLVAIVILFGYVWVYSSF
jgi:hypothetical protein